MALSPISDSIAEDFRCPVIEAIRLRGFHVAADGLEIHLAREFGFCYGVDRAIHRAYRARRVHPGKRIFLTAEIIHNPSVNRKLHDMGIGIMTLASGNSGGQSAIGPDDVVILPAFGAAASDVQNLRATGCAIVDTTCGSVMRVWKRVERYAREGFTAVIHGVYSHEETVATTSCVAAIAGGKYIVVRDKAEARLVCDYIAGRAGAGTIRDRFKRAVSAGFDAGRDLERIGLANQTTMLSNESVEIAGMLRRAMVFRHGEAAMAERFRSFETICAATQDRQDAVRALGGLGMDLIIIVGGFNSSNTTHLVEIASQFAPSYHIGDPSDIISRGEIRQKHWRRRQPGIVRAWLPAPPLRVGVSGGASTPNRAVGQAIERVAALCGVNLRERLGIGP